MSSTLKHTVRAFMNAGILSSCLFCGALPAAAETAPDPDVLLKKMDQTLRGGSHDMTIRMTVKTSRWERVYKIRIQMQGVDQAFARVLEPAKTAGQGFLRKEARLWNYLPTAERTLLIPPSMMLDQFMGSDFTNDDFVKLTYLPRDYHGKILGEEEIDGTPVYHLDLTPKDDAPVIYGKLEIWLRKTDAGPVRLDFYNEELERLRTLDYGLYKAFGKHETPTLWKMTNHQEPDRSTVIEVLDAQFNIEFDDRVFTKEHLEADF